MSRPLARLPGDDGDAWLRANQALLSGLFDVLHARLARLLEGSAAASHVGEDGEIERLRRAMPGTPAIETLATLFGLDPFASDLLLLTAAVELDGRIAALVSDIEGGRSLASVATAFRALPGAHWSAFAPSHPLRRWRLIELEGGDTRFTARGLRLDERVLHFLLGVPAPDPRIEPLLRPLPPSPSAAPPTRRMASLVEQVAAALEDPGVAVLAGRDQAMLSEVLAGAAARLRRRAARIDGAELAAAAATPAERDTLARLLAREARLAGLVLAIGAEDAPEDAALRALPALLARLEPPVAVLARAAAVPVGSVAAIRIEVPGLTAEERLAVLSAALGPRAAAAAGAEVGTVAAQFDLSPPALRAAARRAAQRPPGTPLGPALWDAARDAARPRLEDLAERIAVRSGWDDLVLPPARLATLREIAAQVGGRLRVYEEWGFRDRLSARGLGITALFAGASGTGKTLAAEVVAGALSLDLYRIDLSAVVSKYIGETEKNLRRIFDAAEAGGAVLLFDEADALFGKRSEVKDSHDRYANVEVSYLLQRMESYAGLAVLTTNMKQNLDQAFLRRIRFVVDFPFPGIEERTAIWSRAFPPRLPREGVDPRRLAQMNLPGGAIRNVALNAAFLAAADGGVLRPPHLLAAARSEYAKMEKPLTEAELRGWAEPAPPRGTAGSTAR